VSGLSASDYVALSRQGGTNFKPRRRSCHCRRGLVGGCSARERTSWCRVAAPWLGPSQRHRGGASPLTCNGRRVVDPSCFQVNLQFSVTSPQRIRGGPGRGFVGTAPPGQRISVAWPTGFCRIADQSLAAEMRGAARRQTVTRSIGPTWRAREGPPATRMPRSDKPRTGFHGERSRPEFAVASQESAGSTTFRSIALEQLGTGLLPKGVSPLFQRSTGNQSPVFQRHFGEGHERTVAGFRPAPARRRCPTGPDAGGKSDATRQPGPQARAGRPCGLWHISAPTIARDDGFLLAVVGHPHWDGGSKRVERHRLLHGRARRAGAR
jgi:hypothetical protein